MRGRELINEKIERTIIAGESSKVSYVIKNIPWYK